MFYSLYESVLSSSEQKSCVSVFAETRNRRFSTVTFWGTSLPGTATVMTWPKHSAINCRPSPQFGYKWFHLRIPAAATTQYMGHTTLTKSGWERCGKMLQD